MALTKAQTKFIEDLGVALQKAAKKYGFPFPSVPLGQACQETGFGRKSTIWIKAGNPFGIKWDKRITDNYYMEESPEEYNGKDTMVLSKWCVFKTLDEAAEGYFKFLQLHSHYAPAWGTTSAEECITHIAKTYATRSTYKQSVWKIICDNNLTRFDTETHSTTRTHTVDIGDTLWSISKRYYGNGAKYPIIYNANRALMDQRNFGKGVSKYTIYKGQVLTIPEV